MQVKQAFSPHYFYRYHVSHISHTFNFIVKFRKITSCIQISLTLHTFRHQIRCFTGGNLCYRKFASAILMRQVTMLLPCHFFTKKDSNDRLKLIQISKLLIIPKIVKFSAWNSEIKSRRFIQVNIDLCKGKFRYDCTTCLPTWSQQMMWLANKIESEECLPRVKWWLTWEKWEFAYI